MNMIGTKFYKDNFSVEEYNIAANWCNETQLATIEDKGEYYEVVEIPPPSLEEVKEWKINELKNIRNSKELDPIEYNNHLFDADKDSLDRLNYAIITLSTTHTDQINWTCADNTDTVMSVNDLNMVIANVGIRSNDLHIKYRLLKEQVNQAQTVEEVNSIIWE